MPCSARRAVLIGISTLLGGVAGCSSSTQAPSPSPTRHPSEPGTLTTTASTATTVAPDSVTPFEELSEAERRAFRTALETGSVAVPADRPASSLRDVTYVRFDGDVYELVWETSDMIAEYDLVTTPIPESKVAGESKLVAFDDLTDEGKRAFERALTDGRYTVRDGQLPEQLRTHEYVMYEEEYYRLEVVGDVPVSELSVRDAS